MAVPPSNGNSAVPVGPIMVPDEAVPDRQGVFACMGHSTRESRWVLPRLYRVVALMGEVTLDLTRVQLGAGVSDIEVLVVMGQVNIVVPHNLHVDCDGDSLMGEIRVKRETDGIPSPDAPTVRIHGRIWMGSVRVKVIDPDVPNWRDLRRLTKEANRRARDDARLEARLERDRFRR
jgi:hypothetical protein